MEENEIKISDLPEYLNPDENDILHIIDSKELVNKKIALKNLLQNVVGKRISNTEIRIWDLTTGIYQLPANCKVYYYGSTNTANSFTLNSSAILFATEYSSTYKDFFVFCGGSSNRYLYYGYSTSSSGTYSRVSLLSTLLTSSNMLQKQADMTIESGTTITNGYSITLPTTYIVGRNNLELYWNGQRLIPKTSSNTDGHYQESGTTGSSSSTITIYRSDSDGDYTLTENVHLHVVVKGKNIS